MVNHWDMIPKIRGDSFEPPICFLIHGSLSDVLNVGDATSNLNQKRKTGQCWY